MKSISRLALAPIALAMMLSHATAQTTEEFYSKTPLKIMVGYTPGGGYDTYARLLARYIGKYLPGTPEVIVENLPGAGSITLANQLATSLPKDGSVMGVVGRGIPVEPLLGVVPTDYDAQKLSWIGSMTDAVSVCIAWHTSEVDDWSQVMDGSKELILGGNGAAADNEVYPRMLINLFGANIRIITGYPGAAEVSLAMEQGEVEGQCGSWSSIGTNADWNDNDKIKVLLQLGGDPLPGLENVTQVADLAETEEQRQVLNMILSRLEIARPFLAPPDLPQDRLDALRKAFMEATADPDLVAEAEKMQLELNPMSGEEVAKVIEDIYATPEEVVEQTRQIIAVE